MIICSLLRQIQPRGRVGSVAHLQGHLDTEEGSVNRLKQCLLAFQTGHLLTIKRSLSFSGNKSVIQCGLKTCQATMASVACLQGHLDGEQGNVARSKPRSLAVQAKHQLTIKGA